MPLSSTQCPECQEIVTSDTGFAPGQTLLCPKCETYFTASEPTPRPTRERTARSESTRRSTAKKKSFSIVNAVVALVLLVIIAGGVYSFIVYQRQQSEKQAKEQAERDANPPKMNGPILPAPKIDRKMPRDRKPTATGKNTVDEVGVVLNDLTGKNPPPTATQARQQIDRLRPMLIGTWRSKPGDPIVRSVVYREDGTYRDEITQPTQRIVEGQWEVDGVLGKKGLKLKRTGGTVPITRVVIEEGELIHDADEPGATSVLIKS